LIVQHIANIHKNIGSKQELASKKLEINIVKETKTIELCIRLFVIAREKNIFPL